MTAPALYTKHLPIAYAQARLFYLPGGDREDVLQEARIGLWMACRLHDPAKGAFAPFARTVVRRHLTDRVRTATRDKQRLLTEAIRDVDVPSWDDTTVSSCIARERLALLVAVVRTLSPSERDTLRRILDGDHLDGKSDDNARYRLRTKLRAA
jgi:RNA polymerase sigma factor (sigma-70 family)